MWTTLELGVQLAMVSCGNIPLLGPFAALHNKSGTEHKKHKKRTQEAQEEQKNLRFEFLLVPFVPLVFRPLNRCAKPPLPRRGISPPFKVARYDQHQFGNTQSILVEDALNFAHVLGLGESQHHEDSGVGRQHSLNGDDRKRVTPWSR